jgi:FlaA1/EpsC-like NDP-sugar epimerase
MDTNGSAQSEQLRDRDEPDLPAGHRWSLGAAIDGLVWVGALFLATLLRYDFMVGNRDLNGLLVLVPVAVVLQVVVGLAFGLYTGSARSSGFGEMGAVVKSVALTTVVLVFLNPMFDPQLVPLAVPVLAGIVALLGTAGIRYRRVAGSVAC